MKATFEVDLSDSAQVVALMALLASVSGTTAAPATKKTTSTATKTSTTAATSTAKTEITIEHLKEITAKAVKEGGHRDAVTEKMAEYDAKNISSIPEDKWEEYKEFIDKLNAKK